MIQKHIRRYVIIGSGCGSAPNTYIRYQGRILPTWTDLYHCTLNDYIQYKM